MQHQTETARFLLREILPEDLEGMFQLDADPAVHRYLGQKPLTHISQSADIIRKVRQQYQDYGIGRWAIIDKQTQAFIGWCGLKFVTEPTNDHTHFYDIGYRLIPAYWGMGIATETATEALRYGFEVMKLDTIFASAHGENLASNHILKKIGLRLRGTYLYEQLPCNWYGLDRDSYGMG